MKPAACCNVSPTTSSNPCRPRRAGFDPPASRITRMCRPNGGLKPALRPSTTERTVMSSNTGTVRLHRVLRAPAQRVYRAFLDPDAMVKWLPPHGYTAKVHHMDAKVGGGYRMSFTNFSTGT